MNAVTRIHGAAARQGESACAALLDSIAALGPDIAANGQAGDDGDAFVAENYRLLKQHGFLTAGVPVALGGAGADLETMAEALGRLAHFCGSTALAAAMHTHQVVIAAWRMAHDKAPTEGLLKRVMGEGLVLLSSGGSDWIDSSGRAEPTEGGFRLSGRKVFTSGAPAGDLLMTSAVVATPGEPDSVIHFGLPMKAKGVRIESTWRALGMRGTGSHDVVMEGVEIPAAAVSLRRPRGVWHPLYDRIVMLALPLIYAVYVGLAERAAEIAVEAVAKRPDAPSRAQALGAVQNELAMARLGLRAMLDAAAGNAPGEATSVAVLTGRTIAGRAALRTVELAMEAVGGASMYRASAIERIFRDVQGARFHPLNERAQTEMSGRLALGLPVAGK
ncbi:acyl-CoA dehydrogenase family protein [Desertibaculum subflavum]|uniref:acyl-CoA dehydrogenase family protein n=1 Tax=Desertibaculum subflavum TaxID=2268458 RepID=UPI0013C472AE